jgi:hypothetical protein
MPDICQEISFRLAERASPHLTFIISFFAALRQDQVMTTKSGLNRAHL